MLSFYPPASFTEGLYVCFDHFFRFLLWQGSKVHCLHLITTCSTAGLCPFPFLRVPEKCTNHLIVPNWPFSTWCIPRWISLASMLMRHFWEVKGQNLKHYFYLNVLRLLMEHIEPHSQMSRCPFQNTSWRYSRRINVQWLIYDSVSSHRLLWLCFDLNKIMFNGLR